MTTYLNSLFSLEGRVAVVTGASSGIGRHMAGVLARAGAAVMVVARRESELSGLCGQIQEAGGAAAFMATALSRETDYDALAETLALAFGGPDILVNAAGINPRQPADTTSDADWHRTLEINLSVPFFLTRALVPGMRAKGGGNVINIASLQSYRAFPNGAAYGASKGGILQLTRAMAEAWSRDGISVNAIAPGFFPTDLTAPVFEDQAMAEHHARMTAIGRNGALSDLDGIAIFLASRASGYVTGQTIPVDGGYTAK